MHGRVKVRTSEEEKARKENERRVKLKLFKCAMQKITHKRKEGEFDKELLELTANVLSSNPDIYTIWNIRREILTVLQKNILGDELSKHYDNELQLTEYCLKINPKSYCAWHQRIWVLTTRTDPDWKTELELCNKYLKLDERNFHTWDYRRFVVGQSQPSLKHEFDFTTEKLHDNFSNYSAWHYRSKMLLELYPDLKGGRPIEDTHHKHELKMVINAAFTDPDDTSAWFYQRWLLGAVKMTINLVACAITPIKATFVFNKHVPQNYMQSNLKLLINEAVVNGNWISCTGNQYDNLWIYEHKSNISDNLKVEVIYKVENEENKIVCVKYATSTYIGRTQISFQKQYSQPVVDELTNQLDSCRQLLALEPDNKWTLLTTTIFLHCIDSKQYHKEVIENLHTLKTIDKLRAGYYDYLITKWNIEQQLCDDYNNNSLKFKINFMEKITSLPHVEYYNFCEIVDLSNQNLTSSILPSLIVLQHCKTLNLKNNKLTTLKGFPALKLQKLNLEDNNLDKTDIKLFKDKCNYVILY